MNNNIKINIHKSFILQSKKDEIKFYVYDYFTRHGLKKDKNKMIEMYKNKLFEFYNNLNYIVNNIFIKKDYSCIKYTTINYIYILNFIINEINKDKPIEKCISVLCCDENYNKLINNFDVKTLFINKYKYEDYYNNMYKSYPFNEDYIEKWFIN